MAERWLAALVADQNARAMLPGDSKNPLVTKVEKRQKQLKKEMTNRFTIQNLDNLFTKNMQTSPTVSDDSVPRLGFSKSPVSDEATPAWLIACADQKEQKKKKHKQKKKKKKGRRALDSLSDNLLDKNCRSGNLMAELMKCTEDVIAVDGILWVYDEVCGCYKRSTENEISTKLYTMLSEEDRLKIGSREYKEAFSQLMISEEIMMKDSFFDNRPYVNCLNGVVDVCRGVLLEHSPKYFFKHCIHANYDPTAECPKFMAYVGDITGGDKELRKLLRVIIGYICSHYNNAKKAFLIYGIPHTGKSVLCNLIERILGRDYICHVDLCFLQKQEYAATLSDKLLNVAPDLKNEALKDVGFFKSLVSHDDSISARLLYGNPQDIKCETKMMFSTNHLLSFDPSLSIYDVEAVFNRLIYWPFQNKPISDQQDNKHLSDEIYEERDGIFTWAMKGLRDYVENGEIFPEAHKSTEIKAKNMAKYCPEKIFFEKCLKRKEGVYESSGAIKDAFEQFCREAEVTHKGNIASFLEEHEHLSKSKKRIDQDGMIVSSGNPIWVYEGIRLRKQYRANNIN